MNHIKLVKSSQEHEQALSRLMILMDADPQPNSPEEGELDVLALLVEKYEQEMFSIDSPDPIEAIKFRMEQMNINQKELGEIVGYKSRASEILNKKRKLTLKMIRQLSAKLNIPTEILVKEY